MPDQHFPPCSARSPGLHAWLGLLAALLPAVSAAAEGPTPPPDAPELATVEVHAPLPLPADDPSPGTLAPPRVLDEVELGNIDRLDEALAETGWGTWSTANSMGMTQGLEVRGFPISDQNTGQMEASRILLNGHADIAWRFMRDPVTLEAARLLGGPDATLSGAGSPGGSLHLQTKAPTGHAGTTLGSRIASDGTRRLTLDAERALGPLQLRGVAALHSGQSGFDMLIDRHQAALLSTRLPYGSGTLPRHLQLDLEYHRNHLPYSFGAVYEAGRFWLDHSYTNQTHASADRHYTRQALYWVHGLAPQLTVRAHLQRARATRNETLFGFLSLLDEESLLGYYRELHERYRQSDVGLRLDGHLVNGAAQHQWALAWLSHRQARDFTGPQNIGGFTLDLANPVFPAHPGLLPLSERYTLQNYREQGVGAAWQTRWQGWDLRVGLRKSALDMNSSRHPLTPHARVAEARPLTHSFALGRELDTQQRVWLSRTQSFLPNQGMRADGAWLPARKAVQWEAGWSWQATAAPGQTPGRTPRLSLTLFDIEQSNLPARDPTDPDFFILRGDMHSRGLEMSTTAYTGPLQWTATANFLRARVAPGAGQPSRELPGVAPRSGMVQVAWPGADGTRWWLRARAVDRRPGDGAGSFHAPGYGLVSLGMERPLQRGPHADVRLGIRVDNLADRRYIRAITAADNVWPGTGRRASLWLTASW